MEIYRDKIKKYDAELYSLSKISSRLSFLRLLIFIFSGGILIYLFTNRLFTPFFIVLLISFIGFALVLKYHSKISFRRKHTSFLKKVNESEILRENCELEEFDTGDHFIDQNHPYISDLDIFGQHSIFQLINRTTTESGRILLSEWLSQPAANDEIYERQKAIKELSHKFDWRQEFEASGMHFTNKKSDYFKLLEWVEKPLVLLKYRAILLAVAIIQPVLLGLSTYFFYANLESDKVVIFLSAMILIWVINLVILNKIGSLAEDISKTSTKNFDTLRGYRGLIRKIESEVFQSKKLNKLKSQLRNGGYSAFKEINRICSLLDFSQQRPIKKIPISGNGLYPLINSFLLLDIYLILGTEKWKLKNRTFLISWAEAVSEFEVLSSFAGFCYSDPSYTFPEITEKNNVVRFESMGHPLIRADKRVCNDFYSEGQGNVVMVTGSNMGGKSTFLRTVGVNLVLALAGAPCCAKNGQASNLKLFTSMRTQDNLRAGVSSFYAELDRIEKLLKLIETHQDVFFLLDEMFKGTNSQDRHRGGFSFIHQLKGLKTSGIIATHDIELAKLAGKDQLVTNYSFNSEIKGDSMIFNYVLDPRICSDFNASVLMEKSGIKIIPEVLQSDVN